PRLLPPPTSLFFYCSGDPRVLHSFPTRRSSDLLSTSHSRPGQRTLPLDGLVDPGDGHGIEPVIMAAFEQQRHFHHGQSVALRLRSEEHTSEVQSRENLVCRLLLEKKKHKRTVRP